jgi:alpha-tubulin suppressor-like RCC1 family protein
MRSSLWARTAVVLIAAAGTVALGLGVMPGAAGASGSAVALAPMAAPAPVRAKAVTAGFVHTCALTTKGGVQCWGYNGEGELGNATNTNSAVPVRVSGLSKNVKAISAGSYFTCALTTKGAVKCWGSNNFGQLGDNTTTDSTTPVAVYGLSKNVKAISAGSFFACAVTIKGAVKCWGANTYGQLGNNSTVGSAKPVDVYGLNKKIKAVSGGGYHACALTTGGAAKCWGYNGEGELGDNTKVNTAKPVAVYGLSAGVNALNLGSYDSCALTTKGAVKCWGYNGDGELGNATTTGSTQPVGTSGLTKKVTSISFGDIHACALNTSGVVKCWGYNSYGGLGDNTTTTSTKPVGVYDLATKVTAITAGGYHSCAVTTKGVVNCWGFNAYGQLGNNSTVTSPKPVRVYGLH